MGSERADLGFADALDDFDPSEFNFTTDKRAKEAVDREAVAVAAQELGFKSREVKTSSSDQGRVGGVKQRRRRTGRNAQLNLKAKPETISAYCEIADRMGWGLGETLERAVELLRREYGQ